MTVTFSRLYENHFAAEEAARELEAAGLPPDDVSIVTRNGGDPYPVNSGHLAIARLF
jgi:hypothetical protein